MIRTRFAPSPTGYLHIGGARTALFAWAYARRHQGTFILRIEDTDVARSTPEAVQAILDGMHWLGLDPDEGPYYQMRRMDRYREVIAQMLVAGTAYHCYTSREALDAMRAEQEANKQKPRYDGFWRPDAGKHLPAPPAGVQPVVRFRNPTGGVVAWNDMVKGQIAIANAELDDFIIARADGTPTYNFCVAVDDWDMRISHVIRGDDHVNNTPRQINVLRALGATVPEYGHLPMILGDDGQKLSKRHGAVSVMQYDAEGYLPEAVLNYLARLGWSHGDEEVFSLEQFCTWFEFDHVSASAAQFNTEKLNWLNAQYLKLADDTRLAAETRRRLTLQQAAGADRSLLERAIRLYKERVANLNELADAVRPFCVSMRPPVDLLALHVTEVTRSALATLFDKLSNLTDWQAGLISQAVKETLASHSLKMPQLATPLRVVLIGQTQSPAIDAVLVALGREQVLARLQSALTAA